MDPEPERPEARAQRRRALIGGSILALALLAAAYALYRDRHDFVHTIGRIGIGPIVGSALCGLVGVGATFPIWRELLVGMDVSMPPGEGARVYFTTQLGKYLPGSIWPALMQMEAGRRRGATRATMLWANLGAVLLNCAVGLAVACVLLPIYDAGAFHRYWWVLLAVPALLASVHPRVLPAVINRVLLLLRRPQLAAHVVPRAELKAAAWAAVSWAGFGGHIAFLVAASGASSAGDVARSVGAIALAVPLGVLFIPAPAGAGIRDVVLLLVLRTMMSSGDALAVVVGSRVLLLACDLVLAGAVAAPLLRWRRAGTTAGGKAGG
ncbi:MAG: UPF0104 family protein [Actinomycetota bacterium]|nr:UPF0104 family protein [Actinomycetota bacterium]